MSENTDINIVLNERGAKYGDVKRQAEIAQVMQQVMHDCDKWHFLPCHIRQSLDMIALKMSRIVAGDYRQNEDSWVDIEGFARLGRRP